MNLLIFLPAVAQYVSNFLKLFVGLCFETWETEGRALSNTCEEGSNTLIFIAIIIDYFEEWGVKYFLGDTGRRVNDACAAGCFLEVAKALVLNNKI